MHHPLLSRNMPLFGLAQATSHVPARGGLSMARRRLERENTVGVPVPIPDTAEAPDAHHGDGTVWAAK